MQIATSKRPEVARNARVVRISRPRARTQPHQQGMVASAAMHKPPSQWTVIAAFILAVALHAGAVVWVEMQQAKPTLDADAPVLIHSMEEVFETALAPVPRALPEQEPGPIDASAPNGIHRRNPAEMHSKAVVPSNPVDERAQRSLFLLLICSCEGNIRPQWNLAIALRLLRGRTNRCRPRFILTCASGTCT
jgi:hypothetical protein